MSIVSTRISEELEKELEEFMKKEKLDRSVALRKLISEGIDGWKRERAVKLLSEGKITFNAAADLAGMSVWALAKFVKDKKVTWIKDERIKEDIEAA
ncbi:MAG: UPF0175 family protein [Thermoplasmatota archaeon]